MRPLKLVWLVVSFLNLYSVSAFAQIPAEPSDLTWKAVLMTGDDQLGVFDNARDALTSLFLRFGIEPGNIRQLSMSTAERQRGAEPSSADNLQAALKDLSIGNDNACLVHMTSHGSPQGFYMKNAPVLTPAKLNSIIGETCGSRPTVLLISACYSGVFVSGPMLKPNRIILTAARADLTSFGCSAENLYTYWDGCLIESLPKADNWKSLYGIIQRCVDAKEAKGTFKPSLPQAYFGDQVTDLKIPRLVTTGLTASTSRCPVSDEGSYGLTSANAIKVGLNGSTGPARETQYLSALRGPAGQPMSFRRVGSTIESNSIYDIYELAYDGIEKPVRLYLDEYRFESPKAPAGFVCAMDFGLKAE